MYIHINEHQGLCLALALDAAIGVLGGPRAVLPADAATRARLRDDLWRLADLVDEARNGQPYTPRLVPLGR
jgi:hypothetical protein